MYVGQVVENEMKFEQFRHTIPSKTTTSQIQVINRI